MNMHPFVELAKNTVETYIKEGKTIKTTELTPEMKQRAGVFVTIRKHGELRGCIGTIAPVMPNLAEEIVANAISSSTMDPRFPPVSQKELLELEYSVDVLTKPESVTDKSQLNPKTYGLIVESGRRRGLLLPDIEGVDTVEQQMNICRLKAGILQHEPVKLSRFQVQRYE
jgi:MEMO1 family protein